ncbi:hypothetical protein [Streptomyces sp. NPDC087297]|uniref:hypothetical protein n=1 Tax=Streptomyces sp. NPDC087297 TaxID=3365778 RepID=UPI00381E5406
MSHKNRDASKAWTPDDEDSFSEARDILLALASIYTHLANIEVADSEDLRSERLGVIRELKALHVNDHHDISRIRKDYPARITELRWRAGFEQSPDQLAP